MVRGIHILGEYVKEYLLARDSERERKREREREEERERERERGGEYIY